VEEFSRRFNELWNGDIPSVRIYKVPDAVRAKILQLRTKERPYSRTIRIVDQEHLWPHQVAAARKFLEVGHGILEMATGTGKTRTALAIAKTLLNQQKIDRIIVSVEGTDLLDQWSRVFLKQTNIAVVHRQYGDFNEISRFLLGSSQQALIISRDFLARYVRQFPAHLFETTLVILDEVHGMGSPMMVEKLTGQISRFGYRLGLSATPEREFDETGSRFIEKEVGPIIFQFGLADAIKAGILCEFDYVPLSFRFSEEDENKRRPLIRALQAANNPNSQTDVDIEDIRRRLAAIRKLSKAKIPVFKDYISHNPDTLSRSIIFVETVEYGRLVQEVIAPLKPRYHTYFGEDNREHLTRFANGELECLITSRRISEGIDIHTVDNVILFTADRAKLQTIQRIGRCLRVDPLRPNKRAKVVDFVEINQETDLERQRWLAELSHIRRELDEQ
jgi:superfamily II DNA or RNA helicase